MNMIQLIQFSVGLLIKKYTYKLFSVVGSYYELPPKANLIVGHNVV